MPVLLLRRRNGWGDRFRAYDILVDGQPRGEVRANQSVPLELPAGDHTVELRIGPYGSPAVALTLGEDGATLECGPNRHPLLAVLALLRPRYWVYLRPAEE